MVDKIAYLERYKQVRLRKTGVVVSDDLALEEFENLVALVEVITEHVGASHVELPLYER